MKLMMLMVIFVLTVFVTTFIESTEIDKNSISIENLKEDNLAEHTSGIQKRSLLRLLGLKPRYNPIQISLNWRKYNQQHFTKNNINRFNHELTNTRPFTLHIQKNFFFYNGLNEANREHTNNPETNLSTTPKYYTSTRNVLETISTIGIVDSFSKSTMQQTESTLGTTRFETSTEATPISKNQPTQNVENTKTTQVYQITTSTTSIPQTENPINIITTAVPTIIKVANNSDTQNIKGGFTSTSMPQANEYSELIYDIDPRYRKRSLNYKLN